MSSSQVQLCNQRARTRPLLRAALRVMIRSWYMLNSDFSSNHPFNRTRCFMWILCGSAWKLPNEWKLNELKLPVKINSVSPSDWICCEAVIDVQVALCMPPAMMCATGVWLWPVYCIVCCYNLLTSKVQMLASFYPIRDALEQHCTYNIKAEPCLPNFSAAQTEKFGIHCSI